MLLLAHKIGQIIHIGDDTTVTIRDIEGSDPIIKVSALGNLSSIPASAYAP